MDNVQNNYDLKMDIKILDQSCGCFFVGFEVLTAVVMKSSIFRDIMLCSALLATCFMLVSCLAYSLTLKMATYSSKMMVDFQQVTQRYIPEDIPLQTVF
jgi:hypothetical protein